MRNRDNLDPSHYVSDPLSRLFSQTKPKGFSLLAAQVNAIKDASLARILCDNADNIQLMQPLAFKRPNDMSVLTDRRNSLFFYL